MSQEVIVNFVPNIWSAIALLKFLPFLPEANDLTLLMVEMEYSGFGDQYHACWCPDS